MLSLKKTPAMCLVLLGVLTLSSACTHRTVHQVGSHKVTVARHGFQKSLDIEKRGGVETLEYRGVSTAGTKTTVVISGDKVKVNGVNVGTLREGDAVTIGDDGVAVNSLDYGESEKYLRANSSGDASTQTSALR
ncbi:MAG TPA: hypothetical protein VNO50_08305 [Pyrinomonadaceae bacterium]|nr:hypothetical protein [Pyrinomonadaceae bacterium]